MTQLAASAGTPHAPEARASFASLLSEPNLRRLWISQLCSGAGESLAQIAMPLLVYDLTGSARMVGFIALVLILPRVLLAPLTGLLADRLDRRRLMIFADLMRLILVGMVPLTTSIWQLAVLAVLIAVGNAIGRPAELAAIPAVAGPQRLVAALSLVQVSNGIIRIAVPAIGAGIVAATGPRPVFVLQALCFAISILALRRLLIPHSRDDGTTLALNSLLRTAKEEMWAGIGAIRRIPIVRGVTISESLFQIAMATMTIAGVVYTAETLDLGDRAEPAFALMTTFLAAGAVLGALVAQRIETGIGRPFMLALGYLGPFFLASAFFSPPMPVIYGAWFCFGFMDALAVISFQAYLAESIPDEMRGRVYASWVAIVSLASAIAYYLMGFVTPWLGAPATFALAGLVVGIGGPLSLWWSGAIRSVRAHRSVLAESG
jgi:MFS family permease